MLGRGAIKIRRAIDDAGRPHGLRMVLLADALESVRQDLRKNIV